MKTAGLPKVSVIIPCRNEEKFIERCLESLTENNYPREKLEIIVVDGESTDKTEKIVSAIQKKHPLLIRLLKNPQKTTPVAKNIGIRHAAGEVILIAGAHAVYDKNYIPKCVDYLFRYNADNVGGILQARPSNNSLAAEAIADVLSHPFGTGNARFRLGGSHTPEMVDTVFGGCFRKSIFQKVGFFNEKLVRSQDMEFNIRLKKNGGKILLAPEIRAVYFPKSSLKDFWEHNIKDGIWALLPVKYGAPLFKPRHLLPLFFILLIIVLSILSFTSKKSLFVLLTVLGIYLITSVLVAFSVAIKKRKIAIVPFFMAAAFCRHFGYGIGSFIGLVKVLICKK